MVAVLNKEETIKQCVDSLLAQKYPYEKIMILDGGSTDGTYEILQKYGNKIDLRQFPNTGLSYRLNWALDNIQTEYTALTDADCVVDPDWLNELLKGFEEKDVVATAGYCGTPPDSSGLQKTIGLELDSRFKRLPRYIFRAPTMNLCLKTKEARKTRFDEEQIVAVEVDFGFRLSKLGKILYTPKAKIWHYHRSSWKNYFNQQKEYAKWGIRLIFKHKKRAISDPITTFSMTIQIPLFFLALFFLLISPMNKLFLYPSLLSLTVLLAIYLKNILGINPPAKEYFPLFILFIVRTISWSIGALEGAFLFLRL